MVQFSGLYIVLSLLELTLTLAAGDEEGGLLGPVRILIETLLLLLFIATIACLCNLIKQFGGVLRDVTLVRRAGAVWVFVGVLSMLGAFMAASRRAVALMRLMRLVSVLIDLVFFGILSRSAYLTRQALEREGEPEGYLYSPFGAPQSTASVLQLETRQETMQVTLPTDAVPEMSIQVQSPAGAMISVVVPPNSNPGQTTQVAY